MENKIEETQEECQTYIDSMEQWEKSQRNLMAGHDLDLDHEEKSLELAKESIELLKKRKEMESTFYSDVMTRFHQYLADRNLPTPEWAK